MATPTGEATQQRQRPTTRTRRTTGQNRRPSVKAEGEQRERTQRPRVQGEGGERRQANRGPRRPQRTHTNVENHEQTPRPHVRKDKLQIIPLGGLGEIGKNMTIFQYGDDIVVLDAGLAFPENDMLGVDIVIPDMTYLIENKDKVRAVVITHGHEDHIGSLAYLLKEVNVPVYATNLVCGLIEGKLKEHHVKAKKLQIVKAGDEFKVGCFKVGFIQTNHSIPDACAIFLETPVGTVVHTGDFKVDQTPVDGKLMDVHKFAELGNKGVLALMSDQRLCAP